MPSVSTVSSLVAHQVLEQIKLHGIALGVVEFESDEVFLTDHNGSVIRISRTGPDSGEIVVLQGDPSLKRLVDTHEIQGFNEFFKIPVM